jgi:hypothetical protein
MAKIKLKKYSVIDPNLSEEDRAEVMKMMDKYFVGVEQQAIGQGRKELVDKFVSFLNSSSPEPVKRVEDEIKALHSIQKAEKFRTQAYMLLIDAFQSGMYFALSKEAMEHRLDLLKILGFGQEEPPEWKPKDKK